LQVNSSTRLPSRYLPAWMEMLVTTIGYAGFISLATQSLRRKSASERRIGLS
jgi:hypothetical protein